MATMLSLKKRVFGIYGPLTVRPYGIWRSVTQTEDIEQTVAADDAIPDDAITL